VLAYHDRSDGGVLLTLLEMAFAGHCGLDVDLGDAADGIARVFPRNSAPCCRCPGPRAAEALDIVSRHGWQR